jgi:Fur family ferric uptake transcriptional regulator
MNRGKSYQTRQKDLILSCLRENGDRHMTAEAILSELKAKGHPVGQATIYRYMEKLASDGQVFRFAAPDGGSACYQYAQQPDSHHNHYHLVCSSCGQMIHMDCGQMDQLFAHLLKDHHFQLDSFKTILYGRCESCAAK